MTMRRSSRIVSTPTSSSSKREAPSTDIPFRSHKRPKNQMQKRTSSRSRFFKGDKENEDDQGLKSSSESESPNTEDISGYEDSEDGVLSADSHTEESEEDVSEEEPKTNRKGKGRQSSGSKGAIKRVDGRKGDLWRPGVKTGLEPGTEVYIKKPKAREAGDTPYQDNTIHPNTMLFLKDLAANNDRQWLKMHDPDFRQSEKDFQMFTERLTQKLIQADETIPELPVKDVIFRIYRDVRFSKDQTPYKAHFSAAWSRTGRKGPYAAYYVQIKPGGSFVGGGLWHPEAPAIAALRRDIDSHPERLKAVLLDARIRQEFFSGAPKVEKKVVEAFVHQNKESALKTKPKGYENDHRDIELLRLRNFTMGKNLKDSEITGTKGFERIGVVLSTLVPFVSHLNDVVMPDEDGSNETDDED